MGDLKRHRTARAGDPSRPFRPALALALVAIAAGPAAASPPELDETGILVVSEEMRSFVAEHVGGTKPIDRLSSLKEAILSSRGLGLDYAAHQNRTAAETFRARSGNCLSFANLFVALAREVGLDAYYSEVDDVLTRGQRGESLINNKHMFVTVEVENAHFLVDFTPGASAPPGGASGWGASAWGMPGRWARYRGVRRISDRRAAAHYFNNLGVERLLAEGPGPALAYFEKAVELAPELSSGWVNLGVARRRGGSFEGAEQAYRRAIEIDASELAAQSNLAYLYEAWGRSQEAAQLLGRVERYRRRNPFRHFALGQRAVQEGELVAAVEYFEESVRRGPEEARFHFALGDAHYRQGELGKAADSLRRAVQLADSDERRQHYARALAALEGLQDPP